MSDVETRPDVTALIQRLRHDDAAARMQAAQALGSMGTRASRAVPALLDAFWDPVGQVRAVAGWAVFTIGPDETAIPTLIRGLRDENAETRFHSAHALPKVRPTPIKALPALLEALQHEEKYGVVDFVCWALQRTGPASVPPLAEMLHSDDARLRHRAARALMRGSVERIGQALRPLVGALDDRDQLVRATALQSLGENARAWRKVHGTLDQTWDSVAEAAARMLSEAGDGLRVQAAKTLWQLGDRAEAITDTLVTALREDDHEDTRRWAALALEQVHGQRTESTSEKPT